MGPIFQTQGLTKTFGGLMALNHVDFQLNEGEIKAVIGPNGAGKTTFFNLITGTYAPTAGKIFFYGQEITGLPPYKICRKGIARTYQITSLFQELTVRENIRLAVQLGYGDKLHFFRKASRLKEIQDKVDQLLALMNLEDQAHTIVSNMSHGDQRLLEVAVALGSNPKVLLLDEPTAGMSAKETKDMIDKVQELYSKAIVKSVIIIEHDMEVVIRLAHRICVLNQGLVLKDGTVDEVRNDPLVQEVYLGGRRRDAEG